MNVRRATIEDQATLRELWEDDEGAAGSLRATMLNGLVWHIVLAYIRPRARQQGLFHALMREALAEGGARGSERVTLDVLVANEAAVAVWRRDRKSVV